MRICKGIVNYFANEMQFYLQSFLHFGFGSYVAMIYAKIFILRKYYF